MINDQPVSKEQLLKIQHFLNDVSETNEDTEYDPSQDTLVNSIQEMVRVQGKTSIIEDFETPYIHPMTTIQKWNEELKRIADEMLNKI